MIKGKTLLAIIPARGGSKGIPRKNIRMLAEKPLIVWTLTAAQACNFIDRIVVSTDDQEIAKITREYGVDVPFIRPSELANDTAETIAVVFHALEWLSSHENYKPDYVLLLQPTSPLRSKEDIEGAVNMLENIENARAVVSVCETLHHPWWTNRLPENGCMKDFMPQEILNKRRQDLPVFYRLNGAIYVADRGYLLNNRSFLGPATFAYKMPQARSIDVDSVLDLKMAEIIAAEKAG